MLKSFYKILIILGVALGVLSGMFFIGSYQLNEVRQREEQIAIAHSVRHALAYVSFEGNLNQFSYMHLNEKQYSLLASAIPKNAVYAPFLIDYSNKITANNVIMPNITILHTNENLIKIANTSLLSGKFPNADNECAVNTSFLSEFGLKSEGAEINVDEAEYKITGVFKSTSINFVFTEEPTIILPFNGKTPSQILIRQNTDEDEGSFKIRIENIQEKLIENGFDGYFPHAHTISDIILSANKRNVGTIIMLALLAATFFGECIACVNIMALAKDALMSNQMQIGLKLAVGASYACIFKEYFYEIFSVALKGCLFGLSAAAAAIYLVNNYAQRFIVLFNVQSVIISLLATALAVFVASLVSFIFIIKKQPVQLLKAR